MEIRSFQHIPKQTTETQHRTIIWIYQGKSFLKATRTIGRFIHRVAATNLPIWSHFLDLPTADKVDILMRDNKSKTHPESCWICTWRLYWNANTMAWPKSSHREAKPKDHYHVWHNHAYDLLIFLSIKETINSLFPQLDGLQWVHPGKGEGKCKHLGCSRN